MCWKNIASGRKGRGVDPFGYNFAPYGYAAGQVLAQAVEGSASFVHAKIADYLRSHALHTVVGEIAFGKDGEWTKPRMAEHKAGDLIYPFAAGRK
jgi:branched-chain amino acid transport system substrate-binding protein